MSRANTDRTAELQPWWRSSVGYEVYIRSFADSDGDGIGDLRGLRDRLEHLAWLGIDIVWITPFSPSPMVDYGYDVADYVDVNPVFGSLADFDAVVDEANRLGMKVVIDIVPNHTSDQHEWFRAARSSVDHPMRDYYLWRDPTPEGGYPNNWVGNFGGPAWTLDEASNQHYLHSFFPEQPDLNWRNPSVVEEFDRILRFWLERGVAGFRIDVAQALVKDEQLRSNPEIRPVDFSESRWEQWNSFEHRHDILQPETLAIFKRWRAIVEEYDGVLIGETYVLEANDLAALLPGDGLHIGFWFKTMHMPWSASALRDTLAEAFQAVDGSIGWVQSSHDDPRPATRFGGGDVGRHRAQALSTLLMGLPGLPFIYQGEELAIEDGVVPTELKADPVGGDDIDAGRDGCRTPMPWSLEPGEGFTTGTPWLPSSHASSSETVAGQRDDPGAPIHRVRALIALRRDIDPDAGIEWIEAEDDIVAYRRDGFGFVLNAGDCDRPIPEALHSARVLFSSIDSERVGSEGAGLILAANEAVVVR